MKANLQLKKGISKNKKEYTYLLITFENGYQIRYFPTYEQLFILKSLQK